MLFGPKFSTLVFTDTSIKIAAAKVVSNRFKILHLAKKNLPAKTVFNGRIINLDLFRDALKALFFENIEKLKTKILILGLNEQETFIASVEFGKKPKHLEEAIGEQITGLFPYSNQESTLIHKEISRHVYQIAATRNTYLQEINDVFSDSGFNLQAIVPIPLIFPKLVGERKEPYLFISAEEDLLFALVIKNSVKFTSTFRLRRSIVDSEEEITKFAQAVIDKEYTGQQPLKSIILHGKGGEFLKGFLSAQGFEPEIIFGTDKTTNQSGHSAGDFARAITLAIYDNSVLTLPSPRQAQPPQINREARFERKINPIYLFLPLIAIAAITSFIFWPNLKDIFFAKSAEQNLLTTTKESTVGPRNRPDATSSGQEKKSTPTPTENKLDRTDVVISILNGSGQAGKAGDARDFLAAKGYKIESVGNADSFNYKKTEVAIKNSKKQITDLLTKDLMERYSIDIGSPLPEDESFDILIIIGGN
ncbi:MAG: LytR C-terminal domain-containing protein [Candidatus Woykebacteria bacterium]